MDEDENETAKLAEHSSFSPDTRCYHFASQNLFLSKNGPSHFGLAGGDNRIYLVYEQQSKLEIYNYTTRKDVDQSTENEELIFEMPKTQHQQKEEFILERTVLLHDAVDIDQVIYSSIAPEFFVLLINGGGVNNSHLSTNYRLRSLKAYTNYMNPTKSIDNFKLRGSGELVTAMMESNTSLPFHKFETKEPHFPDHLHSIDSCLNVIDIKHADISTLANYVHVCPVSGNLLICTANGTTLLYTFCCFQLSQPFSDNDFVAIDFVLAKSITILDGWTPDVVKLSLNYVAFMSMSSAHFSLLQIVLDDHDQQYNSTTQCHKQQVKEDPKYLPKPGENQQTHLIYNRLFDEPVSAEMAYLGFPPRQNGCAFTSEHADTVWGPVGYKLGCKFAIYNYSNGNTSDGKTTITSSTYKLLFCRHLPLPPKTKHRSKGAKSENNNQTQPKQAKAVPNELRRIEAKNSLVSEVDNYFMFGFELLPYQDRGGAVFAHALYILSAGRQLDCYLIDLRRDSLRLVPISRLTFETQPISSPSPSTSASKLVKTFPSMSSLASTMTSISTIKNNHNILAISKTSTGRIIDFTANPQEDLVHVLLDSGSLDSYATQIFPFLVSDRFENLYCSRPIASMYRISANLFLNIIAAFSSPRFVYLLSGSAESTLDLTSKQQQHTIYYLQRPSIDHLQADILSALDDLKSNSDEMSTMGVEFGGVGRVNDRHSFHRLYLRVLAIIKFAIDYPMRSQVPSGYNSQSSAITKEVTNLKVEADDTKSEDFAAMQCLQALYEKVKTEIAEIKAEGATCTDPTCPFSDGLYQKEFL